MKKKIAIAVLITGLGLAGINQAFAGWGARSGYCPNAQGAGYNQLDPAVQEKVDAFFTANQDLRKALVMKRAEHHALMRSDNPDPAAASQVAGELFDLQTSMQQKAVEAGVAQYLGPMGGGFGMGDCRPGMRGPGMGGRGMGGQMMDGPGAGGGPRF
ncbi:MAG: periplasmic heavy metal sensor [Desulfofustis sp.]|nr:periplasmic heavy metal sensor [Desulfofustis sp.]